METEPSVETIYRNLVHWTDVPIPRNGFGVARFYTRWKRSDKMHFGCFGQVSMVFHHAFPGHLPWESSIKHNFPMNSDSIILHKSGYPQWTPFAIKIISKRWHEGGDYDIRWDTQSASIVEWWRVSSFFSNREFREIELPKSRLYSLQLMLTPNIYPPIYPSFEILKKRTLTLVLIIHRINYCQASTPNSIIQLLWT